MCSVFPVYFWDFIPFLGQASPAGLRAGVTGHKRCPATRSKQRVVGKQGRLWSCTALNSSGCTRANGNGVRRLCGGLPPHVSISGNPPHPETSHMQPHSNAYGTDGGPGGIAFSDSAPGGFRFLSPCRKEQRDIKESQGKGHNSMVYRDNRHGNAHISIRCGSVLPPSHPFFLPHAPLLCYNKLLLYDIIRVVRPKDGCITD